MNLTRSIPLAISLLLTGAAHSADPATDFAWKVVSFAQMEPMAFIVTRSGQRAPTSATESLAAFDLAIGELNLR